MWVGLGTIIKGLGRELSPPPPPSSAMQGQGAPFFRGQWHCPLGSRDRILRPGACCPDPGPLDAGWPWGHFCFFQLSSSQYFVVSTQMDTGRCPLVFTVHHTIFNPGSGQMRVNPADLLVRQNLVPNTLILSPHSPFLTYFVQCSSSNARFLGQFEPCLYWELNSFLVTHVCPGQPLTVFVYTQWHLLLPLGHITKNGHAITSVVRYWLELMEYMSPKLETFNPLDCLIDELIYW